MEDEKKLLLELHRKILEKIEEERRKIIKFFLISQYLHILQNL
ncbi:MAG: hypothetical protein QXK48_01300 [Candidatus Aenigmatarchaeota archaeon]